MNPRNGSRLRWFCSLRQKKKDPQSREEIIWTETVSIAEFYHPIYLCGFKAYWCLCFWYPSIKTRTPNHFQMWFETVSNKKYAHAHKQYPYRVSSDWISMSVSQLIMFFITFHSVFSMKVHSHSLLKTPTITARSISLRLAFTLKFQLCSDECLATT